MTTWQTRELGPDDGPLLQSLCEDCADFYELAYQRRPGAAEAQSIYSSLPDGATYADKILLGFFHGEELVAAVDVIKHTRRKSAWQIGLILVKPDYRHRGLGANLYRTVRDLALSSGAEAIELSVEEANRPAIRFWLKQGFVQQNRTGDVIRMRTELVR